MSIVNICKVKSRWEYILLKVFQVLFNAWYSCVFSVNSYQCVCRNGFTGQYCQNSTTPINGKYFVYTEANNNSILNSMSVRNLYEWWKLLCIWLKQLYMRLSSIIYRQTLWECDWYDRFWFVFRKVTCYPFIFSIKHHAIRHIVLIVVHVFCLLTGQEWPVFVQRHTKEIDVNNLAPVSCIMKLNIFFT